MTGRFWEGGSGGGGGGWRTESQSLKIGRLAGLYTSLLASYRDRALYETRHDAASRDGAEEMIIPLSGTSGAVVGWIWSRGVGILQARVLGRSITNKL